MNNLFKAYIGGFRLQEEKWYLGLYLLYKGKAYRDRRKRVYDKRRNKLYERALRNAASLMHQATFSNSKFMQFVRPEPKQAGGTYHVPKT